MELEKLEAQYAILQGTLEAERLVDRLRAAVLGLPPLVPRAEDDPPPPPPPPPLPITEAETDPDTDDDGSGDQPPEDPFKIFLALEGTVEVMSVEIARLKRAMTPPDTRPSDA